MKKTALVILWTVAILYTARACDCYTLHFCTYVKDTASKIAIQARVIAHKDYGLYNKAVYLEVLKKYKEDWQITDTIKIYGSSNDAGCEIRVLTYFPIGQTVLLAMGAFPYELSDIVNPDSLQENFYEIKPNSCSTVLLMVEDGIVTGRINEGVFHYPLSHFDQALSDCDYSDVGEVEFKCPEVQYTVFPNPSVDGWVRIRSEYLYDAIARIRIFSIDGRLLATFHNLSGGPAKSIEIDLPGRGIQVLEISCGDRFFYKKVVVP